MRRIGKVVRAVGGMVVARSKDGEIPEIGSQVIDERLDAVGHVVDVMGPEERPYVVIAPIDVIPAHLLNEPIYIR